MNKDVFGRSAATGAAPRAWHIPQGWTVALGKALICGFIILNLVLIALRTDLSIREDPISTYLTGPHRGLAVLAFVLLSAGTALLAYAVNTLTPAPPMKLTICLAAYSAGVLIAGVTAPDSPTHAAGALTAFAVVPLAALASNFGARIWWFAVIVSSFATWPILHFGLGERLTVLLELALLLLLRQRPRRRPDAVSARAS